MKILVPILAIFLFSCSSGSENIEMTGSKDEINNSLPSLSFTDNKSMKITISDCDFDKTESLENTIYSSSLQNGEVKLILGSLLTCDYKNGAFIKELTNKPETVRFEIFQKGSKLSNECKCFFYYEITLKNRASIPTTIFIGDELFTVDKRQTISEIELQEIKSKLKK